MFGPLGYTVAPAVRRNRSLYKLIKPFAQWYVNLMGYRKVGLRYDDLIVEENAEMQRAISRLTPQEAYDRSFRFKVASQCSILHNQLPKDKWLPAEQDRRYLTPHIENVIEEENERRTWDTMEVERK